jgi:hypothetical protein
MKLIFSLLIVLGMVGCGSDNDNGLLSEEAMEKIADEWHETNNKTSRRVKRFNEIKRSLENRRKKTAKDYGLHDDALPKIRDESVWKEVDRQEDVENGSPTPWDDHTEYLFHYMIPEDSAAVDSRQRLAAFAAMNKNTSVFRLRCGE